MNAIEQLLAVSSAYRDARGLSVSRTSFLVFGDGKVLKELGAGERDITTRRLEGALRWFSENWPDGAEWPAEVSRPERVSEERAAPAPSPFTAEPAR
jgi:hypothetical protein